MPIRPILLVCMFALLATPADAGPEEDIVSELARAIAATGADDLESALDHVEVAFEPLARDPDRLRITCRSAGSSSISRSGSCRFWMIRQRSRRRAVRVHLPPGSPAG